MARRPVLPLAVLAFACATAAHARAHAQASVDADVTVAWPYVFRGEVMTTRPIIQPRAWLAAGDAGGRLSLGLLGLVEPRSPSANDFTLRANGQALAEWDAWADYTLRLFGADLTAGVTHYQFGEGGRARFGSASWTELYVAAERAYGTPLVEAWWYRVRYFHGLSSPQSRYAELALGPQLLLFPLRDVSLAITGTAGLNLSRAGTAGRRPGMTRTVDLTHYELAATFVSMPPCPTGGDETKGRRLLDRLLPTQLALRAHIGQDSLTRLVKQDHPRRWFPSIELVWSPFRCATSR